MTEDLLKTVRRTIKHYGLLDDAERVVVAFSGGPDSTALLFSLRELGYPVFAVHVNHHLRETAGRDASFCASICEQYEIPCRILDADVKTRVQETGESVEEAARILRYELIRKAANEWSPGVKIATAHQTSDQAETVLFQMIRGSGLRGTSGIPVSNDGLIRPLLFTSREAIVRYLNERNLPFVSDETNETDVVSRNYIRHHVIPALQSVRKDAVEKIVTSASYMKEADEFLREEAKKRMEALRTGESDPSCVRLSAEGFSSEPDIMQRYMVAEALRALSCTMKDKTGKHLDAVRFLANKPVGKTVSLPKDGYAVRTYDAIEIRSNVPDAPEETPHYTLETCVFPASESEKKAENLYTKRFDYDKISGKSVELRSPEPGDRIAITKGSHKTLRRFLIDQKIPKEERPRLTVVAAGEDVLLIPGVRASSDFSADETTKMILEITVKKESAS